MNTAITLPSRLKSQLITFSQGILTLALTLFGLLIITFTLSAFSPVDPVLQIVGDHASLETYNQVKHELGLDLPIYSQFFHYVAALLEGQLGTATSTGQPVIDDLLITFPATLELATIALLFGASLGILFGVLCARFVGTPLDIILRIFTLLGSSVPVFWLGLILLLIFYATLQWTAGPGRLDDIYQFTIEPVTGFALIDTLLAGDKDAFFNAISHLILPVSLLAYFALASITRLTRSACLNEMDKEYVTLARAKGVSELRILFTHVLPNIRGVLMTIIALSYTGMLEGAVLTETVFSWPGIGRYLTTALFAGDATAIMGGTLVIGLCFVFINNITDIFIRLTDPRLR